MDGVGDIATTGSVSLAALALIVDRVLNWVRMRNGHHPNAKLADSVARQTEAIERQTTALDQHERESVERWRDGNKGLSDMRETLGEIKGMMK